MERNIEKAFYSLKAVEPTAGLGKKVLFRIGEEKRKMRMRRIVGSSFLGGTSVILAFPIFGLAVKAFSVSGFWEYLSLLGSNPDIALTSWKDSLFLLIESFPAIESALVLSIAFCLLLSIKMAIGIFITKPVHKTVTS